MRSARAALRVASVSQLRSKYQEECRKKGITAQSSSAHLTLKISYGRYVADCPVCAAGISVDPDWSEAGCMQCGYWFGTLEVPDDLADIVAELEALPQRERNWEPEE
jgi:hypothetical protein